MEIKTLDGKLVCSLCGHFDTLESQKLDDLLKNHLTTTQPVVFEMKEVTYISSAFLRICICVSKKVGARNFTLNEPTPPIKRVFKMAGLSELFAVD